MDWRSQSVEKVRSELPFLGVREKRTLGRFEKLFYGVAAADRRAGQPAKSLSLRNIVLGIRIKSARGQQRGGSGKAWSRAWGTKETNGESSRRRFVSVWCLTTRQISTSWAEGPKEYGS